MSRRSADQARVQTALAMLTSATAVMPTSAWTLAIRLTAPLLLPEEVLAPDEVPLGVLLPEDADGTNVAPALDTQDVSTALAAETLEGARGLTVPFPAKLQAWPLWLLSSYHSLMANDSFMARVGNIFSHNREK
jgi:hypothetical protein